MTRRFKALRPIPALLIGCALQALPTPVAAQPSEQVSPPYPPLADGDGHVINRYATARWAENWTSLADPERCDDPLDRLKHVALAPEVYLSFSGEIRARTNYTANPGLVEGEHQRQDILRVVAGADLHVTEHLRFFGEIAHASTTGHNIGTPATNLANDLVLQQAFVEATGEIAGVDTGIRYGRQEFFDGSSLLVSQRDNNAIPYTLNGVRAWARFSRARIDAFDLKPTLYGSEALGDDTTDHATRFSGVTLGLALPKTALGGSELYVDPFFWRLRQRALTWLDSSGREERLFAGAHVWGKAGKAQIDWTADYQWGRYGNRDIRAWQVFLNQTVPTGLGSLVPNAGFVFNYASGGGGNSNDLAPSAPMRNAIAPFGANTPFAHHLFLSATNIIALAPKVEVRPAKNLRILGEYEFVWRDSVEDAIYRTGSRALARTADNTARKTGELPRIQLQWSIAPRIQFVTRYEHVFAGQGLKQAGYGDSDFVASWISLLF
ncbi:alginate export family protein [Novosphingobium profundi]|uniref:alginate export family protein n=1 Tax=Novosphingobium profundi TaxID=1774954 RepID=UPI001BDA5BEC|nr:alginate export family protein [Novosphingobium profundi]MBT0671735.1 alginate export family protein [Novosphingobium profundi]